MSTTATSMLTEEESDMLSLLMLIFETLKTDKVDDGIMTIAMAARNYN